ncbi:chloride channel protein [Periweissella beninensis]|uniref:chloride channel protein n=1 Tax=Periweissella beninensis TaxID=504936 RepID=UPI00288A0612|nr:chloride channel protein [Periweissella beninensis]
MANFIAHQIFDLQPVLRIIYVQSFPLNSYWLLLLMGLILGLLGYLYQIFLLHTDYFYRYFRMIPRQYHGIIAFLLVIPIGWQFTDTLGGAPIYESLLAKIVVPKQLATLRGQTDTVEIIINQPSHLAEKQVRDINWPKGALLVKIFRGEQELVPNGDLILQVGDRLEILTDGNQRSLVWQTMTKLN